MKYQHGVLSVSGAALWGSISISPISPRCEWHCQCHRWWWGGDCALWSITIWQFEERSHGFLRSGGKRRGGVNIYGERSSASQRRENLHGERSEGSKCRILSPSLWMFNPISSNYVQPDFPMRKKTPCQKCSFQRSDSLSEVVCCLEYQMSIWCSPNLNDGGDFWERLCV